MESLAGSVGSVYELCAGCGLCMSGHTVGMVFGGYFEQCGERLLVLVYRWPDLLCNLESKIQGLTMNICERRE